MDERRTSFEHDGHRFEIIQRREAGAEQPRIAWTVTMDGAPALEFEGAFPYRDADLRTRILEWYGIQHPQPDA